MSILVAICAVVAMSAQSAVTIDNTGIGGSLINRTWTLSGLNNSPPLVDTANATLIGELTGIGNFDASDTIALDATGYYGWNPATAQAKIDEGGGAFTNGLFGLTQVPIGQYLTDLGVDSSVPNPADLKTTAIGVGEVMVFEVNLSLANTNEMTSSVETVLDAQFIRLNIQQKKKNIRNGCPLGQPLFANCSAMQSSRCVKTDPSRPVRAR